MHGRPLRGGWEAGGSGPWKRRRGSQIRPRRSTTAVSQRASGRVGHEHELHRRRQEATTVRPGCELVQPVRPANGDSPAASGAGLTVYSLRGPAPQAHSTTFGRSPDGLDAVGRPLVALEHSWRLDIETVPTLIRLGSMPWAREAERTVGLGPNRVGTGDRPRLARPGPSRLPAGLRLEERRPRHGGDPRSRVRLAAPRGPRHRCGRPGGRARAVFRAGLERRTAGGAADPGPGASHAQGNDARPAGGHWRDSPRQRPVHGREGRDKRRSRGLQAGVPAGGPRCRRGGPRARIRDARPSLHHLFLEPDGDRERPRCAAHRHELGGERARSGQPGEREHRPRPPAPHPQRRGRGAGRDRPRDPRLAGQVHSLLRRGRVRSGLAAPQRGARRRSRHLRGHPLRRAGGSARTWTKARVPPNRSPARSR